MKEKMLDEQVKSEVAYLVKQREKREKKDDSFALLSMDVVSILFLLFQFVLPVVSCLLFFFLKNKNT